MAGVVVSEFVSMDGFYADAAAGLDWVTADEEHHEYSVALLERAGLLLFGRITWELFREYWPTVESEDEAPAGERAISALLNRIPKVVISTTMTAADWSTTVRRELRADDVADLRNTTAGEIVVFGSGRLVRALQRTDLVDEYHLLIQPVVLGAGLRLFEPGLRLDLVLDHAEQLRSGVVRHFSRPARGPISRVNYAS
jgi:dihydrofolate reductase